MTLRKLFAMAMLLVIIPPAVAEMEPAAPDASQPFNIVGTGASFPLPLIDTWRVEYNKQFDNVHLNYQSIGSGGGIKQHIEKIVNFAASDKPLGERESSQAPGTLHIPEAIGGIVLAYNLPEVPNSGLKLTSDVVADIFLEKIEKWDDPRIADVNPDLDLPDEKIFVVHRSDGSGTTFVFTDYLSSVSPEFEEMVGKGKSVPWPVGIGGKGNEGVTALVKNTAYSLGYIGLEYAFQNNLSVAYIQNADNTGFVEPTLDTLSAASAKAAAMLPPAHCDWKDVSIVNAPGESSYPIASFTYLLLYEDLNMAVDSPEMADTIVHMIHWMITDGQEYSVQKWYVPIPESVQEIGKQGLARVTYDGNTVFDYDNKRDMACGEPMDWMAGEPATSYEIPGWVKNVAKLWADGIISDSEYAQSLQWLIQKGIIKI